MTTVNFSISDEQLNELLSLYPNTGKNSDVGKLAVEVAKLYFLKLNAMTSFVTNKKCHPIGGTGAVISEYAPAGAY